MVNLYMYLLQNHHVALNCDCLYKRNIFKKHINCYNNYICSYTKMSISESTYISLINYYQLKEV